MKLRLVFIIMILIPFIGIKSQQPIILKDDTLRFGENLLPCISVTIPECEYEKVSKAWIKELQYGTKSQVMVESNEISIFGAKLKNVGPDPVNVYSKLISLDSLLMLYVSIETKKDVYVGRMKNYAEYTRVHDFIKEFSKNHYLEIAKSRSDAEEKKLKELRKELTDLENDKVRLLKTIESGKNTLLEENDNLVVKNNELAELNETIPKQNKELSAMEEGNAKKEKAGYIKGLEKKKREALNSIESSETIIKKTDTEIANANRDLPLNEQKQASLKKQIAVQESVFQRYFDKYNKIKTY